MENLRLKLAETEEVVHSQAAEMKIWKKRIESNPTQLDDLLDDYVSKISELEKENKSVIGSARKSEEEHQELLSKKENEIVELRQHLKNSYEETLAVRGEVDSVKEELTGLSSAYTNLESEYKRAKTIYENETLGIQTGKDSEESHHQSNGENPTEMNLSFSEFKAMKTENSKLKKDIRAANDWMSMAVKKMDDLGKQNAELEIEHLKAASIDEKAANEAKEIISPCALSSLQADLKKRKQST
jgi:chromosome segregation ATPase